MHSFGSSVIIDPSCHFQLIQQAPCLSMVNLVSRQTSSLSFNKLNILQILRLLNQASSYGLAISIMKQPLTIYCNAVTPLFTRSIPKPVQQLPGADSMMITSAKGKLRWRVIAAERPAIPPPIMMTCFGLILLMQWNRERVHDIKMLFPKTNLWRSRCIAKLHEQSPSFQTWDSRGQDQCKIKMHSWIKRYH